MSGEGPEPQAIRKLAPGKLVIASHNAGKVREIRALLAPYGIEPVSAADARPARAGGDRHHLRRQCRAEGARRPPTCPACPRSPTTAGCASTRWTAIPASITADWAETPNGRDWTLAMRKVEDALAASGPGRRPRRAFRLRARARLARRPCRMVRRPRRRHADLAAARRPSASATIRCSCRSGDDADLRARWTRPRSTRSATAPMRSGKLVAAVF